MHVRLEIRLKTTDLLHILITRIQYTQINLFERGRSDLGADRTQNELPLRKMLI